MTDRLQELLRQRALIQEHLAWLDREIDDANGIPPLPTTGARPTLTSSSATSPRPAANASDEAEKILGQYSIDTHVVRTDTRRGCLMMFFIGFSLFILASAIGYTFYARHLGRWW